MGAIAVACVCFERLWREGEISPKSSTLSASDCIFVRRLYVWDETDIRT